MFNFSKKTWLIAAIATTLVGTAAYAARWHEHTPQERAQYMTERMTDRLDLNATQTGELRKLADAYTGMRGAAPQFMLDLSRKLKTLAQEETLSVDEVNQLKDEIKAEFDRRADLMIPAFVSFYNTLDSEQKAKVTERISKRMDRMAESRRHHRGLKETRD